MTRRMERRGRRRRGEGWGKCGEGKEVAAMIGKGKGRHKRWTRRRRRTLFGRKTGREIGRGWSGMWAAICERIWSHKMDRRFWQHGG